MTDINKYLLPLDNLDLTRILSTWTWLTDENKSIIALTKGGDALLKDTNDFLYFLDVGGGELKLISSNYRNFTNNKLNPEVIEELLLPSLIDKLENHFTKLKTGQVYSYSMLPILGGLYDENNMFPLDIYEHYNLSREIHFQLKDLPDGTDVKITTE